MVKVERDEAGVRGGCRARGDCKECWKNNRGTHNFLLKKAILTNWLCRGVNFTSRKIERYVRKAD